MADLEKPYETSPDPLAQHLADDAVFIDLEAERKLVRKLDFCIVPVIMLLYLFSFLDRVNIGNAR